MKKISERIIATASTFIFVFLGSYLSILAYGEIMAGTNTQQLVTTGIMLTGVLGISLFSIIFTVNSFRSYRYEYGHWEIRGSDHRLKLGGTQDNLSESKVWLVIFWRQLIVGLIVLHFLDSSDNQLFSGLIKHHIPSPCFQTVLP